MKRILQSLISLLLFPMFIYAENSQGTTEVITLTKAGQLQLTLLDLETDYISSLTIKGPVNGKDIQYLRSGTGKLSKLEELNMADVSLVADEEPYCIITNPIEGTFQHEQYTYYMSDKNYTEYLGVNSISMASTSLYNVYSNRLDGLFNQSNVGKTLKKVTLPHDFSSIGEYAFCGTSVESVIMGYPLKEVCKYAFNKSKIKTVEADWSQLESVGSGAFAYSDFEGNKDNNTLDISRLDSIPYEAFVGCEIKKVILSPNLWFVGNGALCCSSLEEANVPSTLKYLWRNSFGYDSPFFNNLPTEDHVVYLGKFAMCVQDRLSSPTILKFKEGTEYIVDDFDIKYFNYEYIKGLELPSTLKRIGQSAFTCYGGYGNELQIKSITFPEGLEEIGYQAFYENENLEKVTFPSTLKRIGEYAFEGCGLTKVVIPENVTEIELCAFYNCKSLQRVEFNAKRVYDGNGGHNLIFGSCSSLEKVTIGPKVEVIPTGMCRDCRQLIMIEFLERDASAGKLLINDEAFYSCRMEEVVLPEGLDSIGENAFGWCRSLSSLTLPNSLTSIGFNAFYSCTKLKELTIPKNVRNICYRNHSGYLGNGILEGCTALEKLTINCEESFVWTDQRLNSLKEVTLGSNTKTITDRAFYGLTTIEKINLSEGVESIGESAFYSCTGLTEVGLKDSVETIGKYAFNGCTRLEVLSLGKKVASIGDYAFRNCSNLMSAYCYAIDLPTVGFSSFQNSNLDNATLYVPKGFKQKYQQAYGWKDFKNIEEFSSEAVEIVPITETEDKSFNQQMNETADLSNTVIDNTYYNMDAANGDGYDATEQALVLNSTTTSAQMHTVQGAQVGDAAVKDNFCGVIFEIPAGQGTITVDAKTIGTHVLNVQVGNGAPTKVTKSERGTVDVTYDVAAATYVYLYASTADGNAAPIHRAATVGANSVLLYGYKVTIGSGTGINAVTIDKPVDVYTLQGQKVRSGVTSLSGLTKGVYIINGRKVVMK